MDAMNDLEDTTVDTVTDSLNNIIPGLGDAMKAFYMNLRESDVFTDLISDAFADDPAAIISDVLPDITEAAFEVVAADVAVVGTMAADAASSLLTLIIMALLCWKSIGKIDYYMLNITYYKIKILLS